MKTHFAVYRGVSGDDNRYGRFVSTVQRYGGVKDWTATRKFALGDLVLFYFGDPVMSIVAVGFVASKLRKYKGPFDFTSRKEATFCDFSPIWLLKKKVSLKKACYASQLETWYQTRPYRHSQEITCDIASKLLSEIGDDNPDIQKLVSRFEIKEPGPSKSRMNGAQPSLKQFSEGGVKELTVELKQRNPQLRAQAIAVYGETCRVCGFNFENVYGGIGAGYIEVHHLRPLSEGKLKRKVTIENVDFVCANCHRVLHRNGRSPLSLDALRKAIQQRKRQ